MGSRVELQVLDEGTYRGRLLPAYEAWVERRNAQPLIEVLRDAVEKAPDEPSALDLNDVQRHERYVRRSRELAGAVAGGDRGAMAELLDLAAELMAEQRRPGLLTRREVVVALARAPTS